MKETELQIEIPENTAFGFSAVDPETIDNLEDEYTQVVLAEDVSPSTSMCRDEMCVGRKLVIEACKLAPRSDKIMIRTTGFGSRVEEGHGFKPVISIDENEYTSSPGIGGSTCLYDAIFDAVSSIGKYGEILDKSDVGSNGIIFVFTDGMDNSSSVGPQTIIDKMEEIRMKEILESVKIIIIGFNDPTSSFSADIDKYLNEVTTNLGIDQYVNVGTMTKEELAKIYGFVSQSISAQSQSLGTGGPSQNLTF